MIKISTERGKNYNSEIFPELDYPAIAVETAKKAFFELQVPTTAEINY